VAAQACPLRAPCFSTTCSLQECRFVQVLQSFSKFNAPANREQSYQDFIWMTQRQHRR
jgi:hypothetical protein